MAQPKGLDRARHALGLILVQRLGLALADGTIAAPTRAEVAQQKERRRPKVPALADIRAVRFFAHGMQIQATHQVLKVFVILPHGSFDLQPGWTLWARRGGSLHQGNLSHILPILSQIPLRTRRQYAPEHRQALRAPAAVIRANKHLYLGYRKE